MADGGSRHSQLPARVRRKEECGFCWLVFEAHRLLYHSALRLKDILGPATRVKKKKKKEGQPSRAWQVALLAPPRGRGGHGSSGCRSSPHNSLSRTLHNSLSHTLHNSLSHTLHNSLSHTLHNALSHTHHNSLSHSTRQEGPRTGRCSSNWFRFQTAHSVC